MKNNTPVKTDYLCPLCKSPLFRQWGEQTHPFDKNFGVMLFCMNGDPSARQHPAEVSGHGNCRANASDEAMIANAFAIIQAKFSGAKLPVMESDEIIEVETDPAPVEQKPKQEKKKRKINGLRVVEQEPDNLPAQIIEEEEALL